MTPATRLLCLASALGLLLLPAALALPMCRTMDRATDPPTCSQLHPTGAPIAAPPDSDIFKYGQVQADGGWMDTGSGARFLDRSGRAYPVLDSAVPPSATELVDLYPRYIVRARLNTSGTVVALAPVLFVPYSTVLAELGDTQFVAMLKSMGQPRGVGQEVWVRWNLGASPSVSGPSKLDTTLPADFVNLLTPTLDGQECRPALCADPASGSAPCTFFTRFFGNTSAMWLYWDPAMHAPVDTELVAQFSSGITYMAHFAQLYELLVPYSFLRQYTFIIHGNPLETPYSLDGTLTRMTPTRAC